MDEIAINPDFKPTWVVVGIPTFGMVSIQWHMAMSKLQVMNLRTRQMVVVGHEVGDARNYIVDQALADANVSHVFFVDDDVIVPPDAL